LVTDINRPVRKDYESLVTGVYDSDLVPVDFLLAKEAYETINNYAYNKTNGNIQKIVKPTDILQVIIIS
jgi:serine protease inhibitor